MEIAIELDLACPGFLASAFYASPVRRQAIFLTLAVLARDGLEKLALRLDYASSTSSERHHRVLQRHIACTLMTTKRAREIIRGVCGAVPDGLVGVLHRIGDDPLRDPDLYSRLIETFSDPRHRMRRDVLCQHGGAITATQIEIIHRLDPVLVHANVLKRLHSRSQADSANSALALIRGTVSSATDEAIRQSIEDLGPKTDLGTLISRWLEKVDRPPVCLPIPDNDPDLLVMRSGDAMASLGRRFRNCSASRIVFLAQGAEILLEWRHPPGLVAQCHRLTNGGWVLTEIYARSNGYVDPAAAAALRRKLEGLGIPALSPGAYPRTSGVLSLLGAWGGVGRNLGFDETEDDLDVLEQEIAETEHAA
ncbi:hypothetical protein C4E04_08730 [Microvirga sp. 17 mud 1-3]|nr:hypothetical protein C4E04_08730 [Microvirga sp. 17 mud 1-3]